MIERIITAVVTVAVAVIIVIVMVIIIVTITVAVIMEWTTVAAIVMMLYFNLIKRRMH